MPQIELNNVTYYYPETTAPVLKNISFSVTEGEFIGIVGPAGSGKTTLCLAISSLIPNTVGGRLDGSVVIGGMDTKKSSIGQIMSSAGLGKSLVAMTFQDPESQIVGMTIEEDIAFALENAGLLAEEMESRIDEALEAVRMQEYRHTFSYGVSGGQKQRAAIAAALAMKPTIIILDEPTSELDPVGRHEVFSVIRRLTQETNLTIIVVEHEIEELVKYADKILVLYEGHVRAFDSPREVFSRTELLSEVGVRAPEVTECCFSLQQKFGLPPQTVLTEEEAEDYLRRVIHLREEP